MGIAFLEEKVCSSIQKAIISLPKVFFSSSMPWTATDWNLKVRTLSLKNL